MKWVFLAVLFCVFGYFLNAWVVSHALVVDMNGKYQIAAEGWAAVWWIMAAGAVPSLILGMMTSEKIGAAIARLFDGLHQKERVALISDRKKLEAEKNRIFQDITSASSEGRQVGAEMAAREAEARHSAEGRARAMERRNEALIARLKGSHGRSLRKEKAAAKAAKVS